MSAQTLMGIYRMVVELFQSGPKRWTVQLARLKMLPWTHNNIIHGLKIQLVSSKMHLRLVLISPNAHQNHDRSQIKPFLLDASRDFDNLVGQIISWQRRTAAELFFFSEKGEKSLNYVLLLFPSCIYSFTLSLCVAPVASLQLTRSRRE